MNNVTSVPQGKVEVPDFKILDELQVVADETAMIVVDMQNDFVKPDGNLSVPAAMDTVPHIKDLLQRARQAGIKVVYSQDTQIGRAHV